MKRKKTVLVEEKDFDSVLAQLVKMKPIPTEELRTRGQKGSKSPVIPARKSK
jgi:hypothetical protein